jgi:7-dehydrocholesterol reductase
LNPRLFGSPLTDFKWFVEGRALGLWQFLAFFLAIYQYDTLGYISTSMWVSCLFHSAYILHYYYHETNVLAMTDFTTDHHGWMLQWGNGVL